VEKFGPPANKHKFLADNKEITVEEYFKKQEIPLK
jgi:hypothetical protein